MIGMKYLFLEQRAPAGAVENEVTFAFQGARTGMGSWLADAGSGGAAEYLPADALVAGYVSTREPLQLFEEFTAQITKSEPDFERGLASMDEKLGAGFVQNLTAALGTEAALALTGLSASGPTWVDGERGEQSGGRSTARFRSWWTRSTRSLGPTSRASGSCCSRRARADGPGAR